MDSDVGSEAGGWIYIVKLRGLISKCDSEANARDPDVGSAAGG